MLKLRLKSVIFLCLLCTVTFATHQIIISLKEIQVSGKLGNGQPCSPYNGLGINCFPRPSICVEPKPYITNDTNQCAIGSFIDLGVFNNTNKATFEENVQYGGWRNSYLFTFFGDFEGFQVKLRVWNADGPNYSFIGYESWNATEGSPNQTVSFNNQIKNITYGWERVLPSSPATSTSAGITSIEATTASLATEADTSSSVSSTPATPPVTE
uniref:Uncharacterized protein n=1 Tax=Panagrolaimus sp. JU765 TaxID=591449 RepID=A0AC34QKH4_9BILA